MLIEKSQKYNIDLGLCREASRNVNIIPERTYFSYGQIVYRGQQVHLYGRIHIDQKNAMLWKDYGLEGTLEACRVTALPLQTSSRVSPGTGISAIEMQTALREGVFVPYQKQQAEIFKSVSSLFSADQGGMIYQPLIGLHRNVAMIDYVSMYPAIMVYYNISPETITTNVNNGDIVPTLSFPINKNIEGLVPKALRPLLEKRSKLKKRLASFSDWSPDIDTYTRAASALKWLLVVCFGYLGYKNARFGRIEAHQAVTAYSREAVLLAKEAAEDMGYQVIHMYVDGLWVAHPNKTHPDDVDPLLVEIQKRTGLPIALDGIFKWVVFVGSRGNRNRPVANRYFGVFQNEKIKVSGIDARRHDCTPFVGQSQLAIIKLLANRDDPADALPEAVTYIRHRIEALQQGDIPLEDLIVKQRLSRQLKAYRSPSPAARATIQLADIGKEIRPVLHNYEETISTRIKTYHLAEIIAEKYRALLQSLDRLKKKGWGANRVCRDYYDLWSILKRVDLSNHNIPALLDKKSVVRGVKFENTDQFFDEALLKVAKNKWDKLLTPFIPQYVSLETVHSELQSFTKFLWLSKEL